MQRYELEAWLGPALEELSPEQVDRLHQEADDIAAYYPDDQDLQEAALSAAVQYLLGDLTPEQAAEQLRAARISAARASAAAQQVGVLLVRQGETEVAAARRCGITRDTLRVRMGKKRRGC